MRLVALAALLVSHAGVSLHAPAGWHAVVGGRIGCDPEPLAVISNAPVRRARKGTMSPPAARSVVIVVLEDHANRPAGDLRRPSRFAVAWHGLRRLEPCCGLPDRPAWMRWFRDRGRYLGFVVFPGRGVPARTRAQVEAVLDSLRVAR